MHRWLSLVALVALVACGHGKARGPAWPEPSTTAEDGGESIEPRPSGTYAAAIEKSSDAEDDKPAAEASEDTPAAVASEDMPAATPAAMQPPTEDVLMTEEIIIEIEE